MSDDPHPWLGVYLRGLAMGAADAVPGVSGGTIALLTGIYERLIGAVTAIDPVHVKRVLLGVVRADRDAVTAFVEMDGPFLVVLGGGIVTSIVTLTRVLDVAIEEIPVLTFGFFFGLIGASALVLADEVSLDTWGRRGAALLGVTLAFVVSGQASAALRPGPVTAMIAGAIAVSAMILPGLSGSLLLIILGQYEFMVDRLSRFVDATLAVVTGGPLDAVLDPGIPVAAFVAGAFVGLFTISHAVRRALERKRAATLAFLVSLIVGALRAPVETVSDKLAATGQSWSVGVLALFVGAAVLGALGVLVLERVASD